MRKLSNVLIVDNDKDYSFLLSESLKVLSNVVKCKYTFSAEEGTNYLFTTLKLPDLIFLDINLPESRGVKFLSLVKSELRFMNIPIIIISRSISQFEEEQMAKCGAKNLIIKPAHFGDLELIIKKFIKKLSFF